jgi:GPH family glycoside/pentoside/hexuronide:cation symporter
MIMELKKDVLPIKTKVNYGLGSLGLQLTSGLFAAWTLTYYIKIVGINPLLWALAFIIHFFWNAINDPLFGYISDNTHTKYGRRIPYLMTCSPLLSVSFILLYFVPESTTQEVYFIWLLLTLFVYDSFFTIVGLCFNSLLSDLTIEPEERAKLNLFAGLGGGLGIGITYVLPILFIKNVQPYGQNRPIFLIIVLIIAIFGAFFLAFTAFGIKERPELLPEKEERLSFWKATKSTLNNKSFLTFVIFNFMITFVVAALLSNLPFYIQDVLNVSSDSLLSSLPLLFYVIFSVIGLPIGIFLNKRFGNKRTILILSFVVVIGLIMATFANDITIANISFAIIGFGFSGQTLLVYTLLADVIDEDELNTGIRREGMYFGTNALITKPAISLSAAISGMVFFFTAYNQNLKSGEIQPVSAIFGIKLLIGVIPAVFIILGALVLWYYPLDALKKEYYEMKQKVNLLHEQKLQRCRERLACLKEKTKTIE